MIGMQKQSEAANRELRTYWDGLWMSGQVRIANRELRKCSYQAKIFRTANRESRTANCENIFMYQIYSDLRTANCELRKYIYVTKIFPTANCELRTAKIFLKKIFFRCANCESRKYQTNYQTFSQVEKIVLDKYLWWKKWDSQKNLDIFVVTPSAMADAVATEIIKGRPYCTEEPATFTVKIFLSPYDHALNIYMKELQ